jgi:hypothetical protein
MTPPTIPGKTPSNGVLLVSLIAMKRLTDLDEESRDIAPHKHVLHKTRGNRRVDGFRATFGSTLQAPINRHNKMTIYKIIESQERGRADNDEYLHGDDQSFASLMCSCRNPKEEAS